jgi:UDP-2,3-diacylglucosamine pyrophosphatase LpxH
MSVTYYFISDLHIGGDEALGVCDFEEELIEFLRNLAALPGNNELLIIGDIFGLWEFTNIEGPQKMAALLQQFPKIFAAFREAGEKVRITMLPGNHDYEIACYPEFVEILKAYNINLDQRPATSREIAGKRIWIEHGNQYDDYNHMPEFGNPYAQPVGYFVTSAMVSSAGRHSQYGRYNWLKDIQSVYPTEQVPYWVVSNYFYHEMSPWLRWLFLPFLLLSGLTTFVLVGAGFEWFGITQTNIFLNNRLFAALGYLGNLVQIVLTINAGVFVILGALFVPLSLILRDIKETLKRFRIVLHPDDLSLEKEQSYLDAAQGVFDHDPDTVIFIYGHTHAPSLRRLGDRVVINTGTWLKRLERVPIRFGYLPDIYVPFFFLDYFKISEADGKIVIECQRIDKDQPQELGLLQRLLMSRKPVRQDPLPEKILLRV